MEVLHSTLYSSPTRDLTHTTLLIRPWCVAEIAEAHRKGTTLIPLLIKDGSFDESLLALDQTRLQATIDEHLGTSAWELIDGVGISHAEVLASYQALARANARLHFDPYESLALQGGA